MISQISKLREKKGKGKQKMENRDKGLFQFEVNFCVHLYFVQGKTLRKDVEIFIFVKTASRKIQKIG